MHSALVCVLVVITALLAPRSVYEREREREPESSERRFAASSSWIVSLSSSLSVVGVANGFSTESSSSTQRVFVSTPASKFPKRQVGDCMADLHHITALTPFMSTNDAMATLLASGESGAPVVMNAQNRKLVGVVSSMDFLQQEAFEGALLPMEGSRANVEKYVVAAQKICGRLVADVMTVAEEIKTVTPQTSMREAAAIMSDSKLHRLPVVDTQGILVGVLSCSDVMRDLLRIVRNLPPPVVATDDEQNHESVARS